MMSFQLFKKLMVWRSVVAKQQKTFIMNITEKKFGHQLPESYKIEDVEHLL